MKIRVTKPLGERETPLNSLPTALPGAIQSQLGVREGAKTRPAELSVARML